ncbi:methyl-accepting chemotaxis sensory transducer [Brachyspira hampsonii 30446]|uniref:Methyl-accepting chemotaxis sensory transducer n=4 Tax=Brachyspira hampsonii TaxID=1287055 RepID=A0A2U4EUN0_9SPIR|nr:methyl-accepting chemotaxis protein [Brachyspira hampsonii]EKV56388.1 methyl-accepting chemotaxis sensory transducer [Brachyspira hampsonii 30446]OEJ20264.1 chemotaxis protein [Brachyspira hampsonii]
MNKIHSLSFKLPIVISLMSILMLGFLLSVSVYFANKGITESTNTGFQNTVEGYANLFDSILNAQIMLNESYTSGANIKNFFSNAAAYSNNVFLDVTSFIENNNFIENISIMNTDGVIVFDRNSQLIGRNFMDLRPAMMTKLLAGEEIAFGDISKSAATGELTMSLGVRILSYDNQLVGYLVSIIKIMSIYDAYFSNVQLGRTGRIVIVNNKSIVVMDTDPAEINKQAPSEYANIIQGTSISGQLKYGVREGFYKKMTSQPWVVAYAMDKDEIYEINKSIIITSIIIAVISMLLMTLVVFLFTRSIIKPLRIVVEEAKEIEHGKLIMHGRKIKRKDEIGELSQSFHNMKYKLIEVIETTLNNADKMSQAANALASGNKNLATKAENTAANLEETASSMEEISSAISMATNNSVKGNNMMNSCKEAIENASSVVSETVKSMNEVNNDSEKIKDIIKVIEGIAFQTNILALNAAVEAARAGEQGKGFAVVASEVRSLAQNSQTSAKDITELINQVYEKINKANEIVESQEQLFISIKDQIEETANIIKDISSAALEQQSGVAQVNKAVMEMDSITQENAALVEESTASSISLYNDAKELQNVVSFFHIEK